MNSPRSVLRARSSWAGRLVVRFGLRERGRPSAVGESHSDEMGGADVRGGFVLCFGLGRGLDQTAVRSERGQRGSCTRAFSFDARTGHALDVESLFTARGMTLVAQRMHKERMRRYAGQIKLLNAGGERRHEGSSDVRAHDESQRPRGQLDSSEQTARGGSSALKRLSSSESCSSASAGRSGWSSTSPASARLRSEPRCRRHPCRPAS